MLSKMKKLTKGSLLLNAYKVLNYAFNGLKILVFEEHNSRIHFTVSIIVILSAMIVKLTLIEWIIVIFQLHWL